MWNGISSYKWFYKDLRYVFHVAWILNIKRYSRYILIANYHILKQQFDCPVILVHKAYYNKTISVYDKHAVMKITLGGKFTDTYSWTLPNL